MGNRVDRSPPSPRERRTLRGLDFCRLANSSRLTYSQVIEDSLLPEVECFCDQCVTGSSTKLDRVFRLLIQDNHLGEAERILPFYQNVLFEGLAAGYYELGLPVDDVYVLPPESTSTLGGSTRSRSSSASSSTILSDASSVDVSIFLCHRFDSLTFALDRCRGSIIGGSVPNIPMRGRNLHPY